MHAVVVPPTRQPLLCLDALPQLPSHSLGCPHSHRLPPPFPGLLPLPEITVTSAQHGQAAPVSRGCTLYVERPPEQ